MAPQDTGTTLRSMPWVDSTLRFLQKVISKPDSRRFFEGGKTSCWPIDCCSHSGVDDTEREPQAPPATLSGGQPYLHSYLRPSAWPRALRRQSAVIGARGARLRTRCPPRLPGDSRPHEQLFLLPRTPICQRRLGRIRHRTTRRRRLEAFGCVIRTTPSPLISPAQV